MNVGPYELLGELGRGGMGVVWEARHPQLPGRRLALKRLAPGLLDEPGLRRFLREAELLARVRHPGVVAVHEVGGGREGPWLVTDLVEGQPLAALLSAGPLEPRRAAALVAELADAVAALHAVGVLHRDLKPENVLLRPDGRPVLLDFGLARELDGSSLTRSSELLGTPAWMAPEQARDPRAVDRRADVYALGAILYGLLSGRPPFLGGTVQVLMQALEEGPPWPVCAQEPRLDEVCRRAMERDPGRRFPDAPTLASALRAWLDGSLRSPAARQRPAWGAVLVGAALAGAALGWWSFASSPHPPPSSQPPTWPAAGPLPAATASEAQASPAQRPPPPGINDWGEGPAWDLGEHTDSARVVFLREPSGTSWLLITVGLDDLRAQLWRQDRASGRLVARGERFPLLSRPLRVLAAPDGSAWVLCQDHAMHLRPAPGGHGLERVPGEPPKWRRGECVSGALTPAGDALALGLDDGHSFHQVEVYRLGRADPEQTLTLPLRPSALALGSDWLVTAVRPSREATADPDGTLTRWSRADGSPTWQVHLDAPAESLLVDPERPELLVGAQDGGLSRFDLQTGALRLRHTGSGARGNDWVMPNGGHAHTGPVAALTWDPVFGLFYSVSTVHGMTPIPELRAWQPERAEEVHQGQKLPDSAWDVSISPDGRWAVIGTGRGHLLVWRLAR